MTQARPILEDAAALAHQLGDGRLEAYANNYIAMSWAAALSPATAASAIEHAGRAERWLRSHDDLYGLRLSLLLGGMGLQGAGRSDEAVAKMEEAVHIARRFGQDRELAIALQTYATVLLERGDVARARQLGAESLRALRGDQSFLFIARAIDYHALTHEILDAAGAARTLGIGEALRRHIEASRFEHDQRRVDALVARLRAELGDDAFEHAFAEGMGVQPSAAIEEVLRADPQPVAAAEASYTSGAPAPAPAPKPESPGLPPGAPPPEPTGQSADLDVRLLGQLEVSVRGERVRQWPYTKPKELLAYLLLHPQGRSRIDIGSALWPDAAPAQVRNSFHVTMHHLRKTLGHADWVVLEGDRYRLAPGLAIRTDAAEFQERAEAALKPGSPAGDVATIDGMRATLTLYRDHLLAGEIAGPWRDEPQDRLRRLYCDVGMKLGALLDDAQDPAAAATVYEAIVACEPLHEPAHRGLLLALTRAGKRAHALRHYERLSNLLEDIELEPEPETAELYERIRSADIVPNG
jgi:DNA-binding SARP family transcriptional activator/tetratricopeptide (TPR) repeat protein